MTMTEDAFIKGLRALFADRPELKPATVSSKAGLDKATIRKMLSSDGKRSPRLDTADKIAAALGTTREAISNYAKGAALEESYAFQPGFAEDSIQPVPPNQSQYTIANALKADDPGLAFYRLSVAVAALALLPDDVLAVDLATPPSDGDIILVGVTDPETDHTRTEVRRFHSGIAFSADPRHPNPVAVLNQTANITWRGTVRNVLRSL